MQSFGADPRVGFLVYPFLDWSKGTPKNPPMFFCFFFVFFKSRTNPCTRNVGDLPEFPICGETHLEDICGISLGLLEGLMSWLRL